MKKTSKYSHKERGYSDYDAVVTIYNLIAGEFERRIGRWQLNVLQDKFPVCTSVSPEQNLVEFIKTFNLDGSDNVELRVAATKLLAAHKPARFEGMIVKFHDHTPHPEEVHGYRYYDLLIFGDGNYVGVLTRKSWSALSKDKVVLDSNGEPKLDEEGDYIVRPSVKGEPVGSGVSQWCVRGYHDSGWREAICHFFMKTPHLGSLKSLSGWYERFVVTEGDEVWRSLRNRNDLRPWHFDEDHNYIGEQR